MSNTRGINRSLNSLIRHRGIDSDINRYVRAQGKDCFWCGKPLEAGYVHSEHVIPRSKGGADRLDNLVASCSHCNHVKRAKDPLKFAAEVGKDVEEVRALLAKQGGEKTKRATIIFVASYGVDAYIFHGFDDSLICELKGSINVGFHVLLNGYRAFTAPRILEPYLREEFDFQKYDLIDRR